MATPENTFISSLHRYVQCYAEKMNNPYRGGTPDVWYSGRARDLWIEYKYVKIPARPSTLIVPNLSELQKLWLRERKFEGRNVAVVIGCKEGAVFFWENSEWENGVPTHTFRPRIITKKSAGEVINKFCMCSSS